MNYNRGKLCISARVIFYRGNKVLLGLRNKSSSYASDKWMLPGGTTDRHETAIESAIRESQEELGIIVERDDLEFAGMVHWYKESKDTDGATFNWACKNWRYEQEGMSEPENKESHKCDELRWFSVDDLEAKRAEIETTSYGILKQFFKGNGYAYVECDWPEQEGRIRPLWPE